ncbi:MAG TPA: tRNA 2-thiouridine(34) synthase MnmA, partial [Crocinitomicaceae bacterium]|nr:tRNA 2-thiouridine(34) synthase MnmA [Crocinitomicaceae bacterium]
QLNQEQLSKALFPIGELQKEEVRRIALENKLVTAEKKDSQGLCFVGKISLPTFLQQKLEPINGNIIEIPENLEQYKIYQDLDPVEKNIIALAKPFSYTKNMGAVVAKHQGAHYYTIGQRRGLHIGGRPFPSFVIGLDIPTNTVYSGMTDKHPGLNRWALRIELKDIHFISNQFNINNINNLSLSVRIRYRQSYQEGTLFLKEDGLYVLFTEIQRGITPGQFAAFYIDDELIASGVINQ